jgi:hypothetical protein
MNHRTCDHCGQELLASSKVRYEVRIEVKAAYDSLEITEEDLTQDLRAEIAKVIRRLECISVEEVQNEVYREFAFDLCATCQRRFLRTPLPKEWFV